MGAHVANTRIVNELDILGVKIGDKFWRYKNREQTKKGAPKGAFENLENLG